MTVNDTSVGYKDINDGDIHIQFSYKGYTADIERGEDDGDPRYIGTLDTGNTGDSVSFHGDSLDKILESFRNCVDWYDEAIKFRGVFDFEKVHK